MEKSKKPSNLVRIGTISKATGVGIKSLKYYEEIGILQPVYFHPSSGYRYYSLTQCYWIEIIQLAVSLDLPLANLKKYIDAGENIDYLGVSAELREVAKKRIAELNQGLHFLEHYDYDMNLMEEMAKGESKYLLEMEEKYFWIEPYEGDSFSEKKLQDLLSKIIATLDEKGAVGLFYDCGYLSIFENKIVSKYVYVQIEQPIAGCYTAPAGTYKALQSDDSMIQETLSIFPEYKKSTTALLVIEMDIFPNKSSYRDIRKELRVIEI